MQNNNRNLSNQESSKNTNTLDASIGSTKCLKKVQRLSFSTILVKLEKDGITNLKSSILKKQNNKIREEGFYITYLLCSMCRTKYNGQMSLRRRYYKYYCNKYYLIEGHIKAMLLFNNRNKLKGANKMKTHTQGMIDNFLTSKTGSSAKKSNTSN